MTITLFDVNTRPSAPKIDGVTAAQRRQGQTLSFIHGMHLREIMEVEALLAEIDAAGVGETGADELNAALLNLQIASNYRDFGNLCGNECQILTFHHMAENRDIFPALMNRSEGLNRVVERLLEEHAVIHHLLVKMRGQALALVAEPTPEAFRKLRETFETLAEIVRSHFGYEERELGDAIGFYDVAL